MLCVHQIRDLYIVLWASQVVLVVKNLPANWGDIRDASSVPGLGRSSGGGHDNPLQYSCLENPMDRGAWWATVHGITKSQTWLKWLSLHVYKIEGQINCGEIQSFHIYLLNDKFVSCSVSWSSCLLTGVCELFKVPDVPGFRLHRWFKGIIF